MSPDANTDTDRVPPERYAERVPKATAVACLHCADEQDRPFPVRSACSTGESA
jgi:hypothetical protein